MNEQKVIEAIERIRGMRNKYNAVLGSLPESARRKSDYNNDVAAFETAIEALEKQLPKKGIKEKITEGANKGLHKYYCPVCYAKGDLSNKCNVGEYCSDCGQRLDWSE